MRELGLDRVALRHPVPGPTGREMDSRRLSLTRNTVDLAVDLSRDPAARARAAVRRSCSSTIAGSPSDWRCGSTSLPKKTWPPPPPFLEIARAHRRLLAREQRVLVEMDLKAGRIPCLVATSSLGLGIDMGAVDLVIKVESPKSVARGLQPGSGARAMSSAQSRRGASSRSSVPICSGGRARSLRARCATR